MSTLQKIDDRVSALKSQQAAIDAEIKELLVARRVIERLGPETPATFNHGFHPGLGPSQPSTTRELISAVLASNPDPWMSANEIRAKASVLKGADIPMGTISPTLTEMKNNDVLVRDGLKVALATRAKREGAPEGAPKPDVGRSDPPLDIFNLNPRLPGAN